ncbi:hypothetical protein HZS_329 [Henneguya salminicola]|nr:hypothetical protein HZS_329 [Henneguya salminicola]
MLEWYNGLGSVMQSENGLRYVEAFMIDHYCDENLKFWKKVEEFKCTMTGFRRKNLSKEIFYDFIRKGADNQVTLSHQIYVSAQLALGEEGSEDDFLYV